MTVEELRKKLENENVPIDIYSLSTGGFQNETYCLIKNNEGWEVYYSERGKKRGAKQFTDESAACEYLEKKLSKYAK